MDPRYISVSALRLKDGVRESVQDPVTCESPLTIYLNDRELVTLLCTLEYLDELAVGFLYSEGFVKTREDITDIKIDFKQGMARVSAKETSTIAEHTFLKRYITTGCGKGTSFYQLTDAVCRPVVNTEFKITSGQILSLMLQAQRMSDLFKTTGGVHSSAVCTHDEILFFREDIGRHNSVDKLTGRCFLDGIDTSDKILLTTGRISSEILVKVARLGVPLIASRSAPTDLAVKHAVEMGVAIAAFVRNNRMNIYTYPERVLD
jgi:FdhD protein